ncbi:MAG TPA: urease accessory protein UreD [Micropepsaceae bacterium]|nr:urease accessory protein UreD [Micropepsaceae bacterium]
MKVRFPGVSAGEPPEAVLLNLAGGLTGGDRLEFGVGLEEGSSALVTTQACERIYRSTGDDAVVMGRIRLEPGSRMEWLPQPTIFFDGARLKRETHVELAADANLLALECVIFGRTARGETVVSGALSDSWFAHRDGQLIHAECFAVADGIQAALDRPSVLNGNRAMAVLRYIASDAEERIEHMRALLAEAPAESAVISAASAWNGIMIVRFIAADGYRLNCEIGRVLAGFRRKALPRVWSI